MGTAIKHHVTDRVKPSIVIFDIRTLGRSGLSPHSKYATVLLFLFIRLTGNYDYPHPMLNRRRVSLHCTTSTHFGFNKTGWFLQSEEIAIAYISSCFATVKNSSFVRA